MINLEDLVPEKSAFKLKIPNKEYTLRPFNLEDEVWLQKKYGNEIESIFKELRIKEICEIAFHQLEDKSDFKKREVKFVNDEGDELVEIKGGVDLLYSLVSGFDEKIAIINALMATIGVSRPIVEKLTKEDGEKKSETTAEQTGQKSSTSSQVNTDGQPNTSSQELSEKSTGE